MFIDTLGLVQKFHFYEKTLFSGIKTASLINIQFYYVKHIILLK